MGVEGSEGDGTADAGPDPAAAGPDTAAPEHSGASPPEVAEFTRESLMDLTRGGDRVAMGHAAEPGHDSLGADTRRLLHNVGDGLRTLWRGRAPLPAVWIGEPDDGRFVPVLNDGLETPAYRQRAVDRDYRASIEVPAGRVFGNDPELRAAAILVDPDPNYLYAAFFPHAHPDGVRIGGRAVSAEYVARLLGRDPAFLALDAGQPILLVASMAAMPRADGSSLGQDLAVAADRPMIAPLGFAAIERDGRLSVRHPLDPRRVIPTDRAWRALLPNQGP